MLGVGMVMGVSVGVVMGVAKLDWVLSSPNVSVFQKVPAPPYMGLGIHSSPGSCSIMSLSLFLGGMAGACLGGIVGVPLYGDMHPISLYMCEGCSSEKTVSSSAFSGAASYTGLTVVGMTV